MLDFILSTLLGLLIILFWCVVAATMVFLLKNYPLMGFAIGLIWLSALIGYVIRS